MGCCGKTIDKVSNIAVGYARYIGKKNYKFLAMRISICSKCNEHTWMGRLEYLKWLKNNGIDILKNFTQLERLPKLPKYKQSKKHNKLFCRLCKCFIPGKARVEDMKCPLGKWQRENKGDKL